MDDNTTSDGAADKDPRPEIGSDVEITFETGALRPRGAAPRPPEVKTPSVPISSPPKAPSPLPPPPIAPTPLPPTEPTHAPEPDMQEERPPVTPAPIKTTINLGGTSSSLSARQAALERATRMLFDDTPVAPASPITKPLLTPVPKPNVEPEPARSADDTTPANASATVQEPIIHEEAPKSSGFAANIASMLKGIKLPERRSAPSEISTSATRNLASETPAPSGAPEPVIVSEVTKPIRQQDTRDAPVAAVMPPNPQASLAQEVEQEHMTQEARASEPRHERSIVTPLRTLKEDLQYVVQEKNLSVVHAVALEEEKKKEKKEKRVATPEELAARKKRNHRTLVILFSALIMLFLGAAALFGVYIVEHREASGALPETNTILFAEQSVSLPLAGQGAGDIKRTIAGAREGSVGALGSITRVVPTLPAAGSDPNAQRPATTAEFLRAIDAHVPDELLRSLGDEFFFGIHTVDKSAPLFVIPVTSYDHAFQGMLGWEKVMNGDLSPIFTPVPPLMQGDNGIPVERPFKDVVMRNYDARALKDDSGTIELYYSFPTPNILIIAESPYSFTEVLSRLQAARKL